MTGQPQIAVVGIACRYPDATSPDELWQNVLGRRRAFRLLPDERLSRGYRGAPHEPDLTYVRRAALLRDWEFDRGRFGVPAALHQAADHTHWLALETAAAALADAGRDNGDGLDRDSTGVILGNSLTGEFTRAGLLRTRWPYLRDAAATALRSSGAPEELAGEVLGRMEELVKAPFPVPGDESLAGALANTISGRICNHFDFHGTGYTVDGACSSSLLAVMAACRALVAGELDFALAGGVDLSLDPFELVGFARLGALSEGEMRVYDQSPTGFLPGEGCGVVALARAEDAERLGLRTYAHIVGWGSSSDGSGGLTRPERTGQSLALRRAYRMAGIPPESVGLVEGHGTGTAVGDATELAALTDVRGAGSAKAALGSIKANIGHTKAAAGVAGLIKAVLAAHHGVLPPTTGCEVPNELLTRESTPLRVLSDAEPWDAATRRAAVSAMGFGGINAHVVLAAEGEPVRQVPPRQLRWTTAVPAHDIVLVEAEDVPALADRLGTIAATAGRLSEAELHDLAATAWHQRAERGRKPLRAALVADRPERLAEVAVAARDRLSEFSEDVVLDPQAGYALARDGDVRVGLLFPGQAAPVRMTLPEWANALPVPDLPDNAAPEGSTDTAVAQPAIVRQSLAGLAWLERLGCRAAAAAGHSLGEITALVWAGVCTAADGAELAAVRGRIMAEHALPDSTMASLATTADRAHRLIAGTSAVIAAYNGPGQTVISGPTNDIQTVVRRATGDGVTATQLAVSHGFHSPAMQPAVEPFRQHLRKLSAGTPNGTIVSTVTGAELSEVDDLRELLVAQFTAPVRFTEALQRIAEHCDLLVETGPGTILSGLAAATVDTPVVGLDCGGPPRRHAFATAALAAVGAADLDAWFADRPFRRTTPEDNPRLLANPCETPRDRVDGGGAQPTSRSAPEPESAPLPASSEPLPALIEHLAATLELPAESITPNSSLLADLHLNSLQVAQIVGRLAIALGKRLPGTPLSLADATVAEAAAVLDQLDADAEGSDETAVPQGVGSWVRAFASRRVPVELPQHADEIRWAVRAPAGHWLHEISANDSDALAVFLDDHASRAEIAALLEDFGHAPPNRLMIVHNGHPAAAALGRSVAVEQQPQWVRVVELDEPDTRFHPDRLAGAVGDPYAELRIDRHGNVERAVLHHEELTRGEPLPLRSGEVCLVTGGVRGITAYAAAELAERTGCTLVLLGRTAGGDQAVSAAMRDLRTRIDAHYVSCDVTDPAAVAAALAEARRHGPVRGLLHGAGINEPRRLAEVTEQSLDRTLRPKTDGLAAVLDAAADELRLVVAFGSIIGRAGLPGQAEYCLANDVMRQQLETWAGRHPACRTHVLEWSVWSGIGMGVELGVLDSLRTAGVVPMGPAEATAALLDVLATPDAPVTLLVTSRFPTMPTLAFDEVPAPLLRFDEHRRGQTPGVEVVSEATLNLGSDPYLNDHRISGTPVLPAVIGLEAITQIATIGAPEAGRSFTDAEFRRPIAVDGGHTTIRTAVLADRDGVAAVIRDDQDGFRADSVTARLEPTPPAPVRQAAQVPPDPDTAAHPFYGTLLFHSGRFRRLLRYDVLTAFRVAAWIRAESEVDWFSAFHSGELLLGDPGAHDAALHALLPCVPHRLALPVGADRVTVWRRPTGLLRVLATEVEHTADSYRFDIDVLEPDGTAVARWEGLRLRAVSSRPWTGEIPLELVGPWLSRRLAETGLADRVELVATTGSRGADSARKLASRLCGAPVGHDTRGALRIPAAQGDSRLHASASYTDDHLLLGLSPSALGIDWQRIDPELPAGPDHLDLADREWVGEVCDKTGESPAAAATRVWSVREALVKFGHEQHPPLRIDHVTEDGLVVAEAERLRVITARVPIAGLGHTVLALALHTR